MMVVMGFVVIVFCFVVVILGLMGCYILCGLLGLYAFDLLWGFYI